MDTSVAEHILQTHPSCAPIRVLDRKSILGRHKYIVPRDKTLGDLLIQVRKRCVLDETEAIYLFVGNNVPPLTSNIGELYDRYKGADLMLEFSVEKESTFGSIRK